MASKYITRDDFIKSRFGNQNKSYYVLLRKCNLSFSPEYKIRDVVVYNEIVTVPDSARG